MTQHVFQKIGIVVYRLDNDTYSTLLQLVNFLIKKQLDIVYAQQTLALFEDDEHRKKQLNKQDAIHAELSDMHQHCELLIVIGGDGSMLHTARETVHQNLPILGINRGRLGFLNDITPDDMETQLSQILAGEYTTSSRFLFEATIYGKGEDNSQNEGDSQNQKEQAKGLIKHQFLALNDVVIQSVRSRIIDLSLSIDNDFVYKLRADGLVIATPTGSTAYALACGGSIVHPSLKAIEIIPINSHSLGNRPIVVDANATLDVTITNHNMAKVQAVGDGQLDWPIHVGETLNVKKYQYQVTFIHLRNHNFYQSCRTKLNWNKL